MRSAILLAMELTIDKSGRFFLPKKLREYLGISPSGKIEVKETSEGILLILMPIPHPSAIAKES